MADIQTKYAHIEFSLIDSEESWLCRNRETRKKLGVVYYCVPCEKFVFKAEPTIFDIDSHLTIAKFMAQLEQMRKESKET